MQIKKLVDTINRTYVPSEYLRQPDIYYYMDRVIDVINEQLQSCFPTFSEWEDYVKWYNRKLEPIPEPPVNPDDPDDPPVPPTPPVPPVHREGDCPPDQPYMPGEPGLPDRKRYLPPRDPRRHPHYPPRRLKDRTVYDVIPDKYLRTVVALGTALYFYESDEEGEQIAMDYQQRYNQQLFFMVRDYHMLVPPEFQNNTGGYIDFSYVREQGPWDLHPRGVVMNGSDSRIL